MHYRPRPQAINDADHLYDVKIEEIRRMSEFDISRDNPAGGVTGFPEDSWVEVRYPLTGEQQHGDRDAWPWLSGWVVSQCGPMSGRSASRLPNWQWNTRARRCSRCASGIPPSCAPPPQNRRPGHERAAQRPRQRQGTAGTVGRSLVSPHLRDRDLRAALRRRRGAAAALPDERSRTRTGGRR